MQDHRLVRIALFLFFVAISLVYAVFVQVRGEDIRKDLIKLVQTYGLSEQPSATGNIIGDIASGGVVLTGIGGTGNTIPESDLTVDEDVAFLEELLGTGATQILSGTELYYGALDIFKTLGVRYEYILKDTTYDIFYAYMGKNKNYNIRDIVNDLGGKTIEIYARNDIINNLYFGDRVTFVELPQIPSSVTSLFVRMGDDLWFIQDITGQYRTHKRHIRRVFTGK